MNWTNNGERDVLLSATDAEGTVTYQYDDSDRLIQKTSKDGKVTRFAFGAEAEILSVEDDNHTMIYTYDEHYQLSSITIDGTVYTCVLDDMNSVSQLLDMNGQAAVVYTYENGFVDKVYSVAEDGAMTDRSGDPSFIGNINKVTYRSYYYDEDTGWYYCGRFYDVKQNRYVDGTNLSPEEFLKKYYPLRAHSLSSEAAAWYQYIINSSDFGKEKGYSSDWYANLHGLDIIVRLIYAEAPYWVIDKQATGWVLWSRRQTTNEGVGDGTLFGVATAPGQFSTITGKRTPEKDPTFHARVVSTASDSWKFSADVASKLWAVEEAINNGENVTPYGLLTKPYGYTGQLFFCSYDSFFENEDRAEDKDKKMYKNGQEIKDVFIPALGTFTSVEAAEAAYNWNGNEDSDELPTPYATNRVNIYYNRVKE